MINNLQVEMTATCPCCGGKVTPSKLIVDLDANVVTLNGKTERLQPMAAEFLYVLNSKYPGSARYEELINQIYGMRDQPRNPHNVIYQTVSKVRATGERLGFNIEAAYTRGYRLVIFGISSE